MRPPAIALLFALVLTLGASSCATITRGSNDILLINSDPTGANATTSTGLSGTTPATFKVNRRGGFVVKIQKEGFEPVEVQIGSKIHGAGGTALAGNIIFGGLIGVAVDAGTGAAYDLVPNPVNVKLVPLAGRSNLTPEPEELPPADDPKRQAEAMSHLTIANVASRTAGGYLLGDFMILNDNDFAVLNMEVECAQEGSTRTTSSNELLKRGLAAHSKGRYAGVSFGASASTAPLANCRVSRLVIPRP